MRHLFALLPLLASCTPYDAHDPVASRLYRSPTAMQQQEDSSILQAQVDSCEQEIERLQARIHSMESIVAQSEISGGAIGTIDRDPQLEARLIAIEESIFRLQGNIDQVVSFSNEGSKKLSDALKRIASLDNETSRDIQNLEGALRNLTSAVKSDPTNGSRKYKVCSGDTLGKIAREFDTSVETLMELNSLKREDFIVVGQELILPAA